VIPGTFSSAPDGAAPSRRAASGETARVGACSRGTAVVRAADTVVARIDRIGKILDEQRAPGDERRHGIPTRRAQG
jgi:hypothetical protein